MDEKIQQAKDLLWQNGYAVVKMTDRMNKDAEECDRMQESGKDKDCSYCACSICVIQ